MIPLTFSDPMSKGRCPFLYRLGFGLLHAIMYPLILDILVGRDGLGEFRDE